MRAWIERTIFGAWLVATSVAAGASFDVEVVSPKGPVYLGEVFTCYVVIECTDALEGEGRADFPESDALVTRLVGDHVSESGGLVRHSFTFECLAREAGTLKLSGITGVMGDETIAAEPVEIEVRAPVETGAMRLEVSFSARECYAGEAVVVTFEWHNEIFLNGIRAVDVRLPVMNDPRFKIHQPLARVDPNDANAIGIPIENRRVIAELTEERRGDVPVSDVRFQLIAVPQAAGTLELPGAMLLCSYVPPKDQKFSGFRYPSYFNNDFFDKSVKGAHERFLVRSKPIRIEVKPLPVEGRPEDFSGIVGAVSLAAEAEPTVAAVSDPVGLKLRIGGHPFPNTLPAPRLEDQSALALNFDFADEAARMFVEGGEAIVARTIRPLRPNVVEIPAIRLSYFDPREGVYGEAASAPIPMTISSAARVDAFDAVFSDGSKLKNEVAHNPAGISHNHDGERLLRRERPVSWPGERGWLWIAVLGIPPALFSLLRLATREMRLAKRDPDAARARRAFSVFTRSVHSLRHRDDLDPEGVTNLLVKAVNTYVADRFGLCRGAASDQEMARLLARKRVDESVVRELEVFWDRAASAQFSRRGPNGAVAGDAVRVIPEAIGKIERGLKPPRKP